MNENLVIKASKNKVSGNKHVLTFYKHALII